MFEGIYNNGYKSTADFGASRTLGIRGSLMGYIQTGNAYHKDYYDPQSAPGVAASRQKAKSKNLFDRFITFASITGVAAGIFALVKSGKIKEGMPLIKSFADKTKAKFTKGMSAMKKKCENNKNEKFSDAFDNFKQKFSKKSKDAAENEGFFSRFNIFKKKENGTPPPPAASSPKPPVDKTATNASKEQAFTAEIFDENGNIIASTSGYDID